MNENIKKLKSSMYLMIIGDIIGYNISCNNDEDIENIKNKLDLDKNYDSNAIYYTRLININFFYNSGGFNDYKIEKKKVSFNSLYYLAFIDAFVEFINKSKNDIDILKIDFISNIEKFNNDKNLELEKSLYKLNDIKYKNNELLIHKNIINTKFKKNKITKHNSNISLFYSVIIGVQFYNNIDNLIKISLQMTRLINNNAFSYIGSILISLFASFIINKIDIEKWMFEAIDIIKNTDKIDNILKEILDQDKVSKNEYINQMVDFKENKNKFIIQLEKYIKFRFDEKNNYLMKKIEFMKFSDLRIIYYFNNFSNKNYLPYFCPGSTTFDCIIISYDCLLECKNNFELLILYTILFFGDSYSTGGLSLSLFGLMYGFNNIPKVFYKKKDFEMKKNIDKIIKKIKK
jgi:ADP-ribosylglycohydrolase